MATRDNIDFQATPDVEVVLRVVKGNDVEDLEANIDISTTVLELKQTLSEPLCIAVDVMDIYKDEVQFMNDTPLRIYEISPGNILTVKDASVRKAGA